MDLSTSELAPSAEALYAARLIGNEMARCEKRLVPDLSNVSAFTGLTHYQRVYREKLEMNDAFRTWQERLLNVTENEGRRLGLRLDDSMTAWDIWYNQIARPLKAEMWDAWETWYNLPRRYHAAVEKQRQQQPTATPLRVAAKVIDTAHLMTVGEQALSAPGTADAAMPAAPAMLARFLRVYESTGSPTRVAVKGISAGNQISLVGESLSM